MISAGNNLSSIPFYHRLCARAGCAAELTLTPMLDLTQEYNNNILFTEEDTVNDVETRIKPEFHAGVAQENYSLTGGGFLRVREYWDENDLDTVEYSIDLSTALQPIPRLEARASGSYLKDTTLESEIEATGLILSRMDRRRREASAGLGYLIDETSALNVDVSHLRVEYEDPSLFAYTGNVFELGLVRSIKKERVAIMAMSYVSDYRFTPNRTRDYGLTLGFRHQLTEPLALNVTGGGRLSHSRIQTTTGTIREKDWGGLADIALSWEPEKGSTGLGYLLELTPSGLGEVIEKHRVYIMAAYLFSERIKGELYADYFDGKSLGDDPRIDENLFRVRPSASVRISEKIWARLAYEHARFHDHIDDTRATKDRISLTLTATWPRKYHFP